MFLLDVNVLIALTWPSHRHHKQAQSWFEIHAEQGWATCPFTQTSFVRLSSNPGLSPNAVTPSEAEAALEVSLDHPRHHFWPDEISFKEALAPLQPKLVGHRQITDAYLLGLAVFRKGKLATFDSAISSLLPNEEMRQKFIELL